MFIKKNFNKNAIALAATLIIYLAFCGFVNPQNVQQFYGSVLNSDISKIDTAIYKAYMDIVTKYIIPQDYSSLQKVTDSVYSTKGIDNVTFDLVKAQRQIISDQKRFLVRLIFTKNIDPKKISLDSLRIVGIANTGTAKADTVTADAGAAANLPAGADKTTDVTPKETSSRKEAKDNGSKKQLMFSPSRFLADILAAEEPTTPAPASDPAASPPADQAAPAVPAADPATPSTDTPANVPAEVTSPQAPAADAAVTTPTAPTDSPSQPNAEVPTVTNEQPDETTKTDNRANQPADTGTPPAATTETPQTDSGISMTANYIPKLIIVDGTQLIAEFGAGMISDMNAIAEKNDFILNISGIKAQDSDEIFAKENILLADSGELNDVALKRGSPEDEQTEEDSIKTLPDTEESTKPEDTGKIIKRTAAEKEKGRTSGIKKREYLQGVTEFIAKYYTKTNSSRLFIKITDNIFGIKLEMADSQPTSTSTEFQTLSASSQYVEEQKLYLIDIVFSKPLKREELSLSSFIVHTVDGKDISPNVIFVTKTKKEVILLFKNRTETVNANLVKLNDIQSTDKTQPSLNGYIQLTNDEGNFINLTSTVDNLYQAYVGNDITFSATKLSFGKLSQYLDSSSVVAIDVSNVDQANPACAILVFGSDLTSEDGSDNIPIDGMKVITKYSGKPPVDEATIQSIEQQKNKNFIGFLYISDLDAVDGKHLMYLDLSSKSGHKPGKYGSTASVELFCPK